MSKPRRKNQEFTFVDSAPLQGPPQLTFSNSTRTLSLDIPPLQAEHGLEDPMWDVITTGTDGQVTTRTFAAPVGEEEALLISLPQPFAHLEVSLEGAGTASFVGATEEFPFLALDSSDRLANPARGLYPTIYRVIVPTLADAALAHGEWLGWGVRTVDLSEQAELKVTVPYADPIAVPVTDEAAFTWNTAVKTLPNARSLDHSPVYTASPTITLHEPGDAEWTLKMDFVPVGGEREEVSEETLAEGTREVFLSDAYEDPWVGRYEISILKDGVVQDSRFFSIAEGLHMRAKNEGPRGMGFRFCDATGALSPFSYLLASPPKKPIVFEKGSRTFAPDETMRVETVASEAGYALDFRVMPAMLRTSIKRTGTEPMSYFSRQEIAARQLDVDGQLTVYSPQPLPLAKFVSIDKGQRIKELGVRTPSTQALTAVSISNTALQAAVKKQSTAELFLMWSTLTYEDYLAGLNDAERVSHSARPLERRVMEYEATAASDLVYASLGTVRRAPLVTGATLADGHIEVEQSLPAQLMAWAWPLHDLGCEPHPLDPVEFETGEMGFEIPEELAEHPALLVDVRAAEALSDLAVPARPSIGAIAVGAKDVAPTPTDVATAVANVLALGPVAQHTRNEVIQGAYKVALEYMRAHAADAAAALRSSDFAADLTPAARTRALVATGLVAYVPAPCAGAPYDEVKASGVDTITQPMLLLAAGGPAPTPASEQPADAGARIAALRAAFAADIPLLRSGAVPKLRANTGRLAAAITAAGVDKSVQQTIMAFEAFAGSDTPFHVAAWVPYISYVYAQVTQLVAAGKVKDAGTLMLLQEDLPVLADFAALVADLWELDVATAAALHG